jgi:hypothetical protein
MSNSKLSHEQKIFRKAALSDLRDCGGHIFTSNRVTVAIMPEFAGSKMARMSVSIASENEQKLRRKVGEFHALERLHNLESVPVPSYLDTRDMAEMFLDYI